MITCPKKKTSYAFSVLFFLYFVKFQNLAVLAGQYCSNNAKNSPFQAFRSRGEHAHFLPRAPLSERLEEAMRRMAPCFVVTSSKEIDFILATSLFPPPQALGFSRRGERETRVTRG